MFVSVGTVLVLAAAAILYWAFWQWRFSELVEARDLAAALGTEDGERFWREVVRDELEFPPWVETRHDAIEHLLTNVANGWPAGFDSELYWLAVHFLAIDCAKSRHYLDEYIERSPDGPGGLRTEDAVLLRATIERQGCAAASRKLERTGGSLRAVNGTATARSAVEQSAALDANPRSLHSPGFAPVSLVRSTASE